MAKWGFLGGVGGALVGIALAPATGGASLAIAAAAGASVGSTVGGHIDSQHAAKEAKNMANQQLARDSQYQSKLAADRAKLDAQLSRERDRVNAGIAKANRRRFRGANTGFLGDSGAGATTGVLG